MVSPKYCKFYTKVALNHVDNIESIANNVRFYFVGFTRRVESIIVTAACMLNIGACGAVPGVAPKRTGSGPGIVTIISLWQLDSNKEYRLNC